MTTKHYSSKTFAATLKAWRDNKGMARLELDSYLGLPLGTTGSMEREVPVEYRFASMVSEEMGTHLPLGSIDSEGGKE